MNRNDQREKKSDTVAELEIEKLVSGGLGLARVAGEAILTPGSLPGERLKVSLSPPLKGVRRGRILGIIEPSPLRIPPDCPLAGRCGGCDFLHVRAEAALRLKSEAALSEAAAAWGLGIGLLESPLRSRYRSRARLHLGPGDDGRAALGFYGDNHAVIEFEDCLLLDSGLRDLALALRRWVQTLSPDATVVSGAEFSLTLGAGGSGAFITVGPPPGKMEGRGRRAAPPELPAALLKALTTLPAFLARETPLPLGCFARPNSRTPLVALSKSGLTRLPSAVWPAMDLTLDVSPGEFTQVNPAVNKLMVGRLLELAAPLAPGRALDLYSGHGNLALPLARAGFKVTAVEEAPEGARSARLNSRGLIEVIRGRAEKVTESLGRGGAKFDLIVLDPPRAGARGLAPALAALNPEMIVYVACHPAVLPRDVPALASLGYRPFHLAALDMFPRTSHLESLLALRR